MKSSLKQSLFELVKSKGYVTYQEIVYKTNELGHKVDNATRRMRELTDQTSDYEPMIEPVKNEKRIIIGYRWIEKLKGAEVPKPVQTTLTGLNLPSKVQYRNHYDNE